MELRTSPDVVSAAADELVSALESRLAVAERCSLAISGGSSPGPVFERLADARLDWERVDVFQVDERIAPDGDSARNLTGQRAALLDRVPCRSFPMPVTADDLVAAAGRYADLLPDELDVVHLGLGDDGHTASLVPGDPAVHVVDTTVTITGDYRGHRRMTLTYPALHRAKRIVWFAPGEAKRPMLERLRSADPTIPGGRVAADRAVLVTDVCWQE
ncbi:MAG: 6-phosphogluconolactonase [Actinomycetota bacterium]